MAVKTYSVSKLGRNYLVSPHFKLSEFQCRDGSDKVLIDSELVKFLEKLREYLGGDGICTVGINSGYRTPAYNVNIGGASKSKHTEGYAADIVVKQYGKRVSGKLICCLCQTLGFKGIAYIKGTGYAVHVDMRPSGTYRGDERKGYGNNVGGDFYKYFGIKKSQVEALKVVKEEDDDMTQEQFNKFMDNYLASRSDDAASSWSAEEREWAEKLGIVQGDGNNKGYKELVTKEQVVAMMGRFANELAKILKA